MVHVGPLAGVGHVDVSGAAPGGLGATDERARRDSADVSGRALLFVGSSLLNDSFRRSAIHGRACRAGGGWCCVAAIRREWK